MKKWSKMVLKPENVESQLPPGHIKFLLGGSGEDDCENGCGTSACIAGSCRCCCKPGCKKRDKEGVTE